ncbi:HAD-IA family hydrolase [Candidatus Woesearchaeota archaeon]|jgi:HAD superfamily hydrolase (TIGR01509 family)|nr:HAD-IA family hydrolase [Candidatus Woesearchaeota archaeon]
MISTIIFDLNQVIVNFNYSKSDKNYIKLLGVKCDEFWRKSANHYFELDTGKISGIQYLKILLNEFNVDENEYQKLKDLMFNDLVLVDGTLDIIKKLKKNYKLILLAADSEEFSNIKIKKYNLNKYFDEIFISYKFGITKNNPEIYQKVLNKIHVKHKNCIFIDDNDIYLKAAQKAGIKKVIKFINSTKLKKELAQFNITL